MTDKETISDIAKACRILGRLELTHAALGHVSYRSTDEPFIHIKSKGAHEVGLRYTSPDDIVKVDFQAEVLEGNAGLQAPGESFLHLAMYEARPDVQSVVHIHPEDCLLMGMSRRKLGPFYVGYDPRSARMVAEGIPIYNSAVTIHDPVKGKSFASFVGNSDVVIMRGHGITVCGKSIEDATVRAISLCKAMHIAYRLALLGRPRKLSKSDAASLLAERDHSKRGSAGGLAGVQSIWDYYSELTDAELIHLNRYRDDERYTQ